MALTPSSQTSNIDTLAKILRMGRESLLLPEASSWAMLAVSAKS
jgi:hypothetical protein